MRMWRFNVCAPVPMLLAGWYLMLPPPGPNLKAPFADWVMFGAFDSALACEQVRQSYEQDYSREKARMAGWAADSHDSVKAFDEECSRLTGVEDKWRLATKNADGSLKAREKIVSELTRHAKERWKFCRDEIGSWNILLATDGVAECIATDDPRLRTEPKK